MLWHALRKKKKQQDPSLRYFNTRIPGSSIRLKRLKITPIIGTGSVSINTLTSSIRKSARSFLTSRTMTILALRCSKFYQNFRYKNLVLKSWKVINWARLWMLIATQKPRKKSRTKKHLVNCSCKCRKRKILALPDNYSWRFRRKKINELLKRFREEKCKSKWELINKFSRKKIKEKSSSGF